MRAPLAFTGVAAALAAFVIFLFLLLRQAPASLALLALALLVGAVLAWLLLRHAALTALVVLAPLPGLALALALRLPAGLEAYGFGFAAGLIAAGTAAQRLLDDAGREARSDTVPALGLAIAVLLFSLLKGWRLGLPLALCAASAAAQMLWVAGRLPSGEGFIARANRAREARARILGALSRVAGPRWCRSLAGIALVLGVLAGFIMGPVSPVLWERSGLILAALLLLTRDIRIALGGAMAAALLEMFAPGAVGGYGLYVFLALALGTRAAAATPDEAQAGWRRALESEGSAMGFAALGMVLMLAPVSGEEAMALLGGAVAALVFFPALAGACALALPRYRRVSDVYRV